MQKSGKSGKLPTQKVLLMKEIKKGSFTVLIWGAFIANPSYKIPNKKQKQKLLQGIQREENQKVTKESQKVKKQDK